MNIIVTGFEPFLNNEINPTLEVLKLLPKSINGQEIIGVKLPVAYDKSFEVLKPYIDKYNPGIIINLGLAAGRKNICLERVALNISDSKHKDNDGVLKTDEVIIEEGPAAYLSRLPIRKAHDSMKEKGIASEISNTAGLYVCNNLMYHVLHYIDKKQLDIKAGFVHIPYMDKQVKPGFDNSLPLDTICMGIIDIIKETIE